MDRNFDRSQGSQEDRAFSKILFYSFAGRYSAMLLLVAYCMVQNNWIIRAMAFLFIPLILYGLKVEYGVWVNEWRQAYVIPRLVILGAFMAIPAVFLLSNINRPVGDPAQFTVTILTAIFSIVPAYFINR